MVARPDIPVKSAQIRSIGLEPVAFITQQSESVFELILVADPVFHGAQIIRNLASAGRCSTCEARCQGNLPVNGLIMAQIETEIEQRSSAEEMQVIAIGLEAQSAHSVKAFRTGIVEYITRADAGVELFNGRFGQGLRTGSLCDDPFVAQHQAQRNPAALCEGIEELEIRRGALVAAEKAFCQRILRQAAPDNRQLLVQPMAQVGCLEQDIRTVQGRIHPQTGLDIEIAE